MALRRAFAQEDINSLATASVATTRNVDYKDIDLTFTAKATSGEIFKKTDAAAVQTGGQDFSYDQPYGETIQT